MIIDLPALILANRKNQGRTGNRLRRIRPVAPSHAAELYYKSELLRLVRLLIEAKNDIIIPTLQATEASYGYSRDAEPDGPEFEALGAATAPHIRRIAASIESLSKRFGNIQGVADRLAALAVRKAAGESDAAFKKAVQNAVGIDISSIISSGQIGDEIALATRANVALIKSIPQQYFDRIEQSIWTNTGQGMRYDAIKADLLKIDGVTETRAKRIARDQMGKINGAITQARQTSVGLTKYIWRTSNDERVRDSHAAHEGKVFDWNNPPADTGHPGEDYECRCIAEPYIDLEAEERRLGIAEVEE